MSKKDNLRREQALEYHASGRPGKIEVVPTKEAKTQKDLSLAYSPGVAIPCTEIVNNPSDVYKYTAKGNLVGVITNGTAVLGLGNIGPLASKPVMEGKAVLFKIFADIDVFDIEINETDPDKFIEIVKSLEPTFGGINLEDIKAPECFYIEQQLREKMNIPVMHDDQHGTAIISSAALLNALELQKKKIDKAKFVVNGAGAAAMACIKLYVALGALYENFILFDTSIGSVAKLIARNHQFIGVNKAIEHFQATRQKAKDGVISIADAQKLGVFWHTQGSGKSYSMVFLCQKILRVLGGGYTFLLVTDRNELDKQIYGTFAGVGAVKDKTARATSGENLKELFLD